MADTSSDLRILWLGPLHSDAAIARRRAANPAAAVWTRGLLGGLRKNGASVAGLTHCYEQSWPQGDFWPGGKAEFDAEIRPSFIRYPNIARLREPYLCRAYARRVRELLRSGRFDAVVCYNTLHPYHVAALRVASELSVPCFPIILDADDPRADGWAAIRHETQYASGVVFLSYWAACNYPGAVPTLHLDGGAPYWRGDWEDSILDEGRVVYTGALDHYRGIAFLAAVVRQLPACGWRLVLCGRSDREQVRKLFGDDERVVFKGFVDDAELHEICSRAALFISMRPPEVRENIMNFPSKISHYLSYGKPVVSTWIDSFHPDYRGLLQVVSDEDPRAFAAAITDVLAWGLERRTEFRDRVRDWFTANKLWERQASRLLGWMKERSHGGVA
ncbi:MAG: glycosyltransferase family 4 protein [Lentisphaerae bacterium]|nr:glycosyltransferase family 4 protein [Lentisphaerota bacterium]